MPHEFHVGQFTLTIPARAKYSVCAHYMLPRCYKCKIVQFICNVMIIITVHPGQYIFMYVVQNKGLNIIVRHTKNIDTHTYKDYSAAALPEDY